MDSNDLKVRLESWRAAIDSTLERYLPPVSTPPPVIHEAMRYAVLGGGKRLRPILAIASATACGANPEPLMKAFAALELIHTYSLVHDDLPSLDDDDLRRGRRTTHVVFGEAMGILTGDALLTEAFRWLAEPIPTVSPEHQLRAVGLVAHAVDSTGMIGGQVADLEAEEFQQRTTDRDLLLETLQFIHRNKTGRLLTASAELGGLLGGASEEILGHLKTYGEAVGLAFQIVDDLLDVEESAETLGKTAGKDVHQGKLTYPALLGSEEARQRAESLVAAAAESADKIGGSPDYLAPLARYIGSRRS
ncbi:MAG TPA: farnesyl diphosphate synthase [Thermoanaerobaculia bacterium]|nr:farnesyl diphosphate synthase [Thermoanaerobaculia bacterium]